jgi:MiaB-like tRNA modifying enzyme
MYVYIETYGCAYAQGESEIMAGLLNKAGFLLLNSPEKADIIIINSCYVKHTTEQKILFRIKELKEKYPEKILVVAGCMAEASPHRIKEISEEIHLLGTNYITHIASALKKILKGEKVELIGKRKEIKVCLPKIRRNPVVNIVPIASGCIGSCSYCATKFAKGELFSFPKELIVKEVSLAVKAGCKEIWLTAQDTACYGFDRGETLASLLNEISQLKGKFFVRVGMMHPKNVLLIVDELIEAYGSEKIYKFLHLPVQSGSDRILELMKRGYTVKEFVEIVKKFRKEFPQLQLWTDVIVGFPEESEEDFELTKELIKRIKPDYVNISRYSWREGTLATKLREIPSDIKKKRSREMAELVREIVREKNEEWLEWQGEALVSEKGKDGWIARNFAYKPIVVKTKENLLGKFVKVKIVKAEKVLFGELA